MSRDDQQVGWLVILDDAAPWPWVVPLHPPTAHERLAVIRHCCARLPLSGALREEPLPPSMHDCTAARLLRHWQASHEA